MDREPPVKKFPAIGQPGCGTVLSLTLLEFLERLAPLIPPRRLDGAPIEIRLVLTPNMGISTKHVRKDTLVPGGRLP